MIYKFFENVKTVEDLKEQYKKLVFKYHPDKGGKKEDMQQLNAEYQELKKFVGNKHRNAQGETYETKETDFSNLDKFKEIIDKIILFNMDIEICGNWIWCFRAYEYKTQLKKLGFFYCSHKSAWAYTDKPTNNKHRLTMEEIRNLHGSEKVKGRKEEDNKRLIPA